ncbi:Uma2 family endonuclease [Roseofilum sp. BLCC_M91]|uniref:Uma2 family endonuclease n=1 Tax=Roseofilum halophilum BLCC-M91 TaxID=3022259 RepID=A0ABT7BN27_9CYAN|nr:Uma2 family endonuclease [Roseofilum halophilum]MDJ1179959.1 Uma2 family endonuclease [Roseofilum halophilum BLCC-M91]
MTATVAFTQPIHQINIAPGSTVTIPGVTWQEFEQILLEWGEHRSARLIYSQKTLEIRVPLPEHERPKELIADLVKALLRKAGRRFESFGSTTFKQEGIAGVEPDACFYIQNYERIMSRRRLQTGDPPPDLAIEIDITSRTPLAAYEAIAVPELWVYDGQHLTLYLLQEDGHYRASKTSPLFPQINLTEIIPTAIKRSWQVGSSQALEEAEIACIVNFN